MFTHAFLCHAPVALLTPVMSYRLEDTAAAALAGAFFQRLYTPVLL